MQVVPAEAKTGQDLAIDQHDGLVGFVHDGLVFTEMEQLLPDHRASCSS